MSTIRLRGLLALAACAIGFAACGGSSKYPKRPITLIVPWAAGGGTDAIARVFATVIEKDLGKPVNVVNRTGGSGVVGHQAIATAAPDGYTIGIVTVEIAMMHHQGFRRTRTVRLQADQGLSPMPSICKRHVDGLRLRAFISEPDHQPVASFE